MQVAPLATATPVQVLISWKSEGSAPVKARGPVTVRPGRGRGVLDERGEGCSRRCGADGDGGEGEAGGTDGGGGGWRGGGGQRRHLPDAATVGAGGEQLGRDAGGSRRQGKDWSQRQAAAVERPAGGGDAGGDGSGHVDAYIRGDVEGVGVLGVDEHGVGGSVGKIRANCGPGDTGIGRSIQLCRGLQGLKAGDGDVEGIGGCVVGIDVEAADLLASRGLKARPVLVTGEAVRSVQEPERVALAASMPRKR